MNVEQLMTKTVQTCDATHSLAVAAQVMWTHDCGCVPVTDAMSSVIGMITDRDICLAAYFSGKPLHEITVSEAMCRQIFACRPEDSIETTEAVMRHAQIRRVPVTDTTGHLVGILSLNDIAREAARGQAMRVPEVGLYDVALTLSAVSEQHAPEATMGANA